MDKYDFIWTIMVLALSMLKFACDDIITLKPMF